MDEKPDIKLSEVSSALCQLGNSINCLRTRLDLLGERLKGVRVTKVYNPIATNKTSPTCPLADDIRTHARLIEDTTDHINTILEELEL